MENEKQQEEVVETKVAEDVKSEETKVETPSNKNEDGDYRIDLSKPAPEPAKEKVEEPVAEEKVEEKPEQQEESIIQEVTEEEQEEQEVEEKEPVETDAPDPFTEEENKTPEMELPENVEELVKFMNETGGTLEDYVRLNADYSNVDDEALLREYYKSTKPHLSSEEVNFMLEDNFSYDEATDEPRDIKRKQLAHKEAVAQARNHLDGLKAKYYQEVKLGSRLAPEQQKAIDFFNRYNKEQAQVSELTAKQQKHFNQQTDRVFNENFKGFDFQVGDKKYRYNVKDAQQVRENQSDVLNVFSKYIDSNNMLQDAKGYHKSLFAAQNADALANHFYQQGKADAIKQLTSEAKNVNVDGRKTSDGVVKVGGTKMKVISGDTSSSRKFKLKNY